VPHAEFLLLGPVEVRVDGVPVELGGALSLRVLAAVLLDANRVVSVEQIVAACWGEQAPASARIQAQNRVSALRRALREALPGRTLISTRGSGYLIEVGDDELDTARFARGVRDAAALDNGALDHGAMDNGALDNGEAARSELVAALSLWRGPALDGLEMPYFQAAAHRLEEQRLSALERRAELDLRLGRHAELAAEMTALVAAHQFREKFHALLMLALYRMGRRADALEAYRRVRDILTEQLGVDPGESLQHLHTAILRGDPLTDWQDAGSVHPPLRARSSAGLSGAAALRELPADIGDFTGRADALDTISKLSDQDARPIAITGTAGIGKTALAVHWAHRMAVGFPDGQLYINLRGYDTGRPMLPIEALAHLLGRLGTPRTELPSDVEDAAARFRALLAGRRVLVVLDNARTASQVRPLLPGDPGCRVLITSRDRLSGLVAYDGARRVTLGLLGDDEAGTLLRRLIGGERVDAEPEAAAQVVGLCAGLPLALRIASANLADRPHSSLAAYAKELADGNRLAKLAVPGDEDRAVQAVLDRSYDSLAPAAQRVFRLLGLIPGPDFGAEALAALAGKEAASELDALVAAHLVLPQAGDRYTLHDLVREYAGGKATAEDAAALRGLLEYLRDMALVANALVSPAAQPGDGEADLRPRLASASDAMAWFEAEQANLAAAVSAALAADESELAVEIAQPFGRFFHFSGRTSDWIRTFERVFTAIEDLGETKAKYVLLNSLGTAYLRGGRYDDALRALRRCADGREALGEHVAAALSRHNIAMVYESVGRYDEALELELAALEIFERHQAKPSIALVLGSGLSNVYQRMGLWDKALDSLLRGLATAREVGKPFAIVMALNNLGATYLSMGETLPARQTLTEAVALARRIGDRHTEALALSGMSEVEHRLGNLPEAIRIRRSVHAIYREGMPKHEAESLNKLGDLYVAAGLRDQALDAYRESLAIAVRRGEPHQHGLALAGIGNLTDRPDLLEAALRLLEPISAVHTEQVRRSLEALSGRASRSL
jgi:DNA-binding SARP family transcriptional activator